MRARRRNWLPRHPNLAYAILASTVMTLGACGLALHVAGTASASFPGGGGGGGGNGQKQPVCFNEVWPGSTATTSGTVLYYGNPDFQLGGNTCSSSEGGSHSYSEVQYTTYGGGFPEGAWTNAGDCEYFGYGCSSVTGNASFDATYWINSTTATVPLAFSTTVGTVSVTFQFYDWNISSYSFASPSYVVGGCWYGDNSGGGATPFVALGLYDISTGHWVRQVLTDDLSGAQYASCPQSGGQGYGTYSTGGYPVWNSLYNWTEVLTGLTLTKGQNYYMQAEVGCAFGGQTWGQNMNTDTRTTALTTCGPGYGGAAIISSAAFFSD